MVPVPGPRSGFAQSRQPSSLHSLSGCVAPTVPSSLTGALMAPSTGAMRSPAAAVLPARKTAGGGSTSCRAPLIGTALSEVAALLPSLNGDEAAILPAACLRLAGDRLALLCLSFQSSLLLLTSRRWFRSSIMEPMGSAFPCSGVTCCHLLTAARLEGCLWCFSCRSRVFVVPLTGTAPPPLDSASVFRTIVRTWPCRSPG